jgi:hypothetical protein
MRAHTYVIHIYCCMLNLFFKKRHLLRVYLDLYPDPGNHLQLQYSSTAGNKRPVIMTGYPPGTPLQLKATRDGRQPLRVYIYVHVCLSVCMYE